MTTERTVKFLQEGVEREDPKVVCTEGYFLIQPEVEEAKQEFMEFAASDEESGPQLILLNRQRICAINGDQFKFKKGDTVYIQEVGRPDAEMVINDISYFAYRVGRVICFETK